MTVFISNPDEYGFQNLTWDNGIARRINLRVGPNRSPHMTVRTDFTLDEDGGVRGGSRYEVGTSTYDLLELKHMIDLACAMSGLDTDR